MEQGKRYRTTQSAGATGDEGDLVGEFGSHESLRYIFYTFSHTFESVEYSEGKRDSMPTNLAIDDRLIAEAQKVGHHRTKKEAVTAALDEYIRKRKKLDVLEMFGKIDYDENYDYKLERDRKPKRR
jgi:hypothetical protein